MNNGHGGTREFGKCRLDIEKKVLWCKEKPVGLPLKAVELLCVLVRRGGEVVTKDEIWRDVWPDAFVEETNLTHNIYLLRKTFKDMGELDLIQTVSGRGYRFTGEVREIQNGELIVEKHTQTRTLIEIQDETKAVDARRMLAFASSRVFAPVLMVMILTGVGAFFAYQYFVSKAAAAGIRSIAVMPFKTIGTDGEDANRGIGLADVLITRLSNIKELNIRPTSAVMNLEDQDSHGIGEKLMVDAVLEGTIYRVNDKVRVTARLIKMSDNSTVWTGEFEKLQQDELRLQNDIALQIVETLRLNLTGNEKNALTKRYTESADAYELYIKGRYAWNKRSWAGMVEAQRQFRNAIEEDPNFALAYVGLADTIATTDNSFETNNAIQKALELDPNLAEAHASLGFLQMFHNWQWREAETSFKRSIELKPNYATAHHWYATLLAIQGKNDEAKAEMRRAIEINPLSHNFLADLGQIYYFNREYDEAKEYCRKALELYPDFAFAHHYLYYIYLQTGEYDKALEEIITTDKMNYTLANETAERKKHLEASFDRYRKAYRQGGIKGYLEFRFPGKPLEPGSFYFYAMKHAFLGEKEKALDYIEKANEGKAFLSAFVKAEPIFDGLRGEPRYQEILQKMNLNN